MPELSRIQLVVYAAVAVAVLLVGARAIRSEPARSTAAFAQGDESGGATDSFEVDAAGGQDVVVHVAGAVREPAVYRLPAGSRVIDAIERAGGGTSRALLDGVNLAARLSDGQQVVVPERLPAAQSGAVSGTGIPEGPISLGSATVEQLDTIEGIGPVTAQSIVDFRDEHGGLSSIDQLEELSGIGPATMEALRSSLQP